MRKWHVSTLQNFETIILIQESFMIMSAHDTLVDMREIDLNAKWHRDAEVIDQTFSLFALSIRPAPPFIPPIARLQYHIFIMATINSILSVCFSSCITTTATVTMATNQ